MDGWMAEQKTAKAGEEGPSARTAENVPTIVVHQASWLLAVGCGRDFGGEHVLRQLSGRVFGYVPMEQEPCLCSRHSMALHVTHTNQTRGARQFLSSPFGKRWDAYLGTCRDQDGKTAVDWLGQC